jgi:hypothetical protein
VLRLADISLLLLFLHVLFLGQAEYLLLKEQMKQNESLVSSLNMSWEERMQESEALAFKRAQTAVRSSAKPETRESMKRTPYLTNLHKDLLLSESLTYLLPAGCRVRFCTSTVDPPPGEHDVVIAGPHLRPHHATAEHIAPPPGALNFCLPRVLLTPGTPGARVFVNGRLLDGPHELAHGDRVILGSHLVFRVAFPNHAADEPGAELDQPATWELANQELLARSGTQLLRGLTLTPQAGTHVVPASSSSSVSDGNNSAVEASATSRASTARDRSHDNSGLSAEFDQAMQTQSAHIVQLENELKSERSSFASALAKLQRDYEANLAAMRRAWATEIADIQAQLARATVVGMKAQLREMLARRQLEHARIQASMDSAHAADIRRLHARQSVLAARLQSERDAVALRESLDRSLQAGLSDTLDLDENWLADINDLASPLQSIDDELERFELGDLDGFTDVTLNSSETVSDEFAIDADADLSDDLLSCSFDSNSSYKPNSNSAAAVGIPSLRLPICIGHAKIAHTSHLPDHAFTSRTHKILNLIDSLDVDDPVAAAAIVARAHRRAMSEAPPAVKSAMSVSSPVSGALTGVRRASHSVQAAMNMNLKSSSAAALLHPRYDVFISHKQSDCADFARTLYSELSKLHGYKVYLDQVSTSDLQDLPSEVRASRLLLFVLSSHVFESEWCAKEVLAALSAGVTVVPVLYHGARWGPSREHEFPPTDIIPATMRRALEGAVAVKHDRGFHEEFMARLVSRLGHPVVGAGVKKKH